jgi:signal transduction histidine kinase
VSLGLPCENLPEVYADVERVRQVMLNLINNACKYASSGRRIDVVARNSDDGPYVLIEVRDYGPGIGSRRMKNLFKPGYLNSASESAGGLGIGLALCKLLIELHGGRMWADSAEEKGTSIFFTLPLKVENEDPGD